MILPKTKIILVLCLLLIGCSNQPGPGDKPMYFTNPESAVEEISVMLTNKDWPKLAMYYDLSDSEIDRETLISGEFFYTDERPESAHPAGFWHYKHPFPPAFKYLSSNDVAQVGVKQVTVHIEIDQGGGMIQRGEQTFFMTSTGKGYQVLPRKTQAW